MSNFFKNQQLLSIIDELDHQIEKFEIKKNELKTPLNIFKQKSASYLLSSGTKSLRSTFIPTAMDLIIKEEDDNALIVTIKNDSLTSPTFNSELELEEENIFYNEQSEKQFVKYITIDLLIKKIATEEMICENEERYNNLVEGICIEYPNFINKDILLNKLISAFNYFFSRYTNSEKIQHKKTKIPYKIINWISSFISLHYRNNIPLSKENIKKLLEFYETLLSIYEIKNNMENDIKIIVRMLNSMSSFMKPSHIRSMSKQTGIIFRTEKFNIFNYSEEEIAKELTRLTVNLFSKIEYKEFFGAKFTKKDKSKTSPNITEAIEKFNTLSFFVIEEIISYDHKKQRGDVTGKFIKIADELRKLNNFNDCMSIIAGLNHIITQKMKKTWKCVSNANMNLYNSLNKFLSFEKNYKALRTQESSCIENGKPFIPFLGFYTKRICFVEEMGKYIKDGYLLNCDKIADFYGNLKDFFAFKNNSYIIEKQPKLTILQCLKPLNESELEELAGKLEPNFILSPKRGDDKRMTSTDINYMKMTNRFSSSQLFL